LLIFGGIPGRHQISEWAVNLTTTDHN
jgi:hypothetical protein